MQLRYWIIVLLLFFSLSTYVAPQPPTSHRQLGLFFLSPDLPYWIYCGNVLASPTGACTGLAQCIPGVGLLFIEDTKGTFCYFDAEHLPKVCDRTEGPQICDPYELGVPFSAGTPFQFLLVESGHDHVGLGIV